jgi:hypothetical protein
MSEEELLKLLTERRPREAAIHKAIWRSLKPAEQGFIEFDMYFGACPPGHELRPKRDGKRAPFSLSHFEWVPIGTPRRLDAALKAAPQGAGLQEQIDELRRDVEAIRQTLMTFLPVQEPAEPAGPEPIKFAWPDELKEELK